MAPQKWEQTLRRQIRDNHGAGWNVIQQSGKCKLTRRYEDGAKSAKVLPIEWKATNSVQILNAVTRVRELVETRNISIAEAVRLDTEALATLEEHNGTADAWLYWRTKEDGEVDDTYCLKRIKDRSGTVEVGTVYQFTGSSEDRRLTFKGMRDRTVSLDQIATDRERVKRFLLTHEPAKFTAKQVYEHNPGLSLGYCKNLLAGLHGEPLSVIRREKVTGGVGRPSYAYFAVTGKSDKGAKVTNSVPLSTGLTPSENSSESSNRKSPFFN